MTYLPFIVILAILSVVILGLLAYRQHLTAREDDTVHLRDDEQGAAANQQVLALKVAKVDRLGQILTAIVVVGAIILIAVYVYTAQIADTGVRMG